jgi:WD40 repeat protein
VTAGAAAVLSLAPVLVSPGPIPQVASWLAGLSDGPTVLAAGGADGAVRLWDPVTRAPLTELFRRFGQPVVSMTAADSANNPRDGTNLVVVYGDCTVDVWSSAAVHGRRSSMIPDWRKLAALGHRQVIAAAASPRLEYRQPVLLADRNGTVSMWETCGVRLSDPLPPDPAHREVTGIAVLPGTGDGIAVVTASRADRNLRIWEPLRGNVTLVPLSIRPRCLISADNALLIGHDDGILALSLTISPIEGS